MIAPSGGARSLSAPVLALVVAALTPPTITASADTRVALRMVDSDGAAVAGYRLEWWLNDGRRHKHVLECSDAACSEWDLPALAATSAVVSFALLRSRDGEPGCWDELRGRLPRTGAKSGSVDHARKQIVTLRYVATVCT